MPYFSELSIKTLIRTYPTYVLLGNTTARCEISRRMASCLLIVFLLFAIPSWGAEWWLIPRLNLDWEYNDNIGLTTFPHSSVSGSRISPALDFGVQSYLWHINGSADYSRRNYSNDNDAARDSRNYILSSRYATERTTWGLSGNRSYSDTAVNQPADPDIGLLQLEKQRVTSGYAPSWSWAMSERTHLQLSYQKSTAAYEDGLSFGLFDYDSSNVTAGISRQLSAYSQIFLNMGYSVFEVPMNNFESRTNSIQGGVNHSFSDTLSSSISVGVQRTKWEGIVRRCGVIAFTSDGAVCLLLVDIFTSEDNTSSLFGASLSKQHEAGVMSARLNRSLNPSGSGTVVRTDVLDLQANRRFSALLTGDVSTSFYDIRSVVGNITDSDRKIYRISTGLQWHWTEKLSIGASVGFSRLKRDSFPDDAKSHSVLLRLSYQGSKRSISR